MNPNRADTKSWPDLAGGQDVARTLHLWSQIVGKTRLALAPMTNHWWQVPLYLTARGLGTSAMPCGERAVDVELDLLSSRLEIRASDGQSVGFSLEPGTVSAFHARFFEALRSMKIEVSINPLAVEIPETVRLDRDAAARPYDADWVRRFFVALVQADRILKEFRSTFLGKASPVHFFWGSFDLAVSRFSGQRAPRHPGGAPHVGDRVMREAYSHEVSSAGFWPGSPGVSDAIFYSYAYPEPEGFPAASVLPESARYDRAFKEFILPYEAVRLASSPAQEVKRFLETSYVAAAELGRWARRDLERPDPRLT